MFVSVCETEIETDLQWRRWRILG